MSDTAALIREARRELETPGTLGGRSTRELLTGLTEALVAAETRVTELEQSLTEIVTMVDSFTTRGEQWTTVWDHHYLDNRFLDDLFKILDRTRAVRGEGDSRE